MEPRLEWKPIKGFKNYMVSENGDVYSKYKHNLNVYTVRNGIKTVILGEKSHIKSAHYLVASEFIDNPNNYTDIIFIDGNKLNCSKANLKWVFNPDNEIKWFDLVEFPLTHEISTLGVRKKKGPLLAVSKEEDPRVNIFSGDPKKCYHRSIHRLMAIQFVPNPNKYDIVHHKDGNKKNWTIDNLEWCNHYKIQENKNNY